MSRKESLLQSKFFFGISASTDLRKALDNLVSAPLLDIANTLWDFSVVPKVGSKTKTKKLFLSQIKEFLDEEKGKMYDEAFFWLVDMRIIVFNIKNY